MTTLPTRALPAVEFWDPVSGKYTRRQEDLELATAMVNQVLNATGLDMADSPTAQATPVLPGQIVVLIAATGSSDWKQRRGRGESATLRRPCRSRRDRRAARDAFRLPLPGGG